MSHQSEATRKLNQAIAGLSYASVKIQDGEALANLQSQLALLTKPLLLPKSLMRYSII
jgi:hypothetical protein